MPTARRTSGGIPRGLIGGLLGAIGALPLLPLVSGLAKRFAHPPALLGPAAGDVKLATYAEAAVLLIGVPVAALVFGRLIPDRLARITRPGKLSFEWASAGLASSFLLCQRGVRPKVGLLIGLALFVLLAFGIREFRNRFAFRRWFARKNRRDVLRIFFAGAALDLARRSTLRAPTNLVADLMIELFLAGAFFLALAVLACRLRFVERECLSRVACLSWTAFLSAAVVLAYPEIPAAVLLIPLASMFLPIRVPASLRSVTLRRAAFLTFALVFSWRVHWLGSYPLDVFEEGINLSYANEYRHGARPYLETYPLHGWGADGGVDVATFALVTPSVHAARVRQAAWATLAFLCFGAVCLAVYRSAWWGALAFLLTLSVRWLFHDRHLLAVAALLCLVLAVPKHSRALAVAAGVLAAWAVFYSLDFGLMIVLAGTAGLILLTLVGTETEHSYFRLLLLFGAGVFGGAIPLLVVLGTKGALRAFFRISFREIPGWIDAAWGQPAGSAWEALLAAHTERDVVQLLAGHVGPMPSLFLLILLSTCAAVLLIRAVSRSIGKVDAGFLLCLLFACIAMRGALGRADEEHLGRYGFFAGMTGAWLIRSAWRSSRGRGWLTLAAGLLVFAGFHPLRALEWELLTVEGAARRDRAVPRTQVSRGGGIGYPSEQTSELAQVVTFLDTNLKPEETFFDFSNEPALYFLTDRRQPTRFHGPAQYQSLEKQREVIEALERRQPPLAVLPFGGLSVLGGISNRDRAPEVAQYLDEHYRLETIVAGRPIARRR